MEALEGLKILFDSSIGFALCALSLWLAKEFYRREVKGEINAAAVAARAAKEEAKKAYEAVISSHASLSKSFTDNLHIQSNHYESFLEVKALAKNADENVQKLSRLSAQLASRNLHLETEVKKITDSLIFIKNKKGP